MKIVRLEATNVKRLRAVEITPDGNVVIIGGRNAQGKTSVLDAILYALGGKGAICDQPLRKGEDHGHVVCELDELVVKRTFTEAGGGQLVVANREGARYQGPQAMLDKLTGKLTFDPLEFARMDAKRQLETLRGLIGIDLSALDATRADVFSERTEVNRGTKQLEAEIATLAHYDDAPDEEVSVSALAQALERAQGLKQDARDAIDRAEGAGAALAQQRAAREHALAQLKGWQERIDQAQAEIERLEQEESKLRAAASESTASVPDPAPIREQIASAEETNRKVRANRDREERDARLIGEVQRAKALTDRLAAIDQEKCEAMAAAEFPVDGLGFDESGVTFGGLPFAQASSAEQLRVSVAMGLAMNPTLRVLLIRDGSLLDEESMRLVAEMAQERDAQVWLERVGDGDESAVIIEDGAVRGATAEDTEGAAA